MACISAVCIDNNLPSGQSCVAVRSANNKTSGRINEKFGIFIYHFLWKNRVKYLCLNVSVNLFLGYILVMLGGKHHCLKPFRTAVFIILNRYLGLSVRPQVGKRPVLADLCQL